jgi:hypothetical protein
MDSPTRLEIPELLERGLTAQLPFTRAQALEAGVSPRVLHRLADQGALRRLFRSVYVDSAADDTPEARAQALGLVLPPDAVAVDHTAAWLLGVDTSSPLEHLVPPPLSIYRLAGGARVRRAGCAGGERQLLATDLIRAGNVRHTTGLRTALDLGRLLRRDHALAAMDGLARKCSLGTADLESQIPRFRGFRGVLQLRWIAPLVDPKSESPGESRLRLAWLDAGLPRPVLQHYVSLGASFAFLDIAAPEYRFAAEYDGWDWHSAPEQVERDEIRRDRLAEQGWRIAVFTRQDFQPDPELAVARLRYEFAAWRNGRGVTW